MPELHTKEAILRTMSTPRRMEELNIVGYANVLDETMLPSIVPPIFCLRSDSSRNFLPPYLFNAGYLCNPTEVPESEIHALRDSGEITIFSEPFRAQVGFELFIDRQFQHHYELRETARDHLTAIARGSILEAEDALSRGDYDEADRLAGIAISADDRKLEPLVIKAAVSRLQREPGGERLMATLAEYAVSEELFSQMVDKMMERCGSVATPG